jgi:DNA repair protein RAD7
MENCELCRKRFTVTPYSRTGPSGGLLCNPCGKELDKEEGSAKKKPKRTGGSGGGRRKVQSRILDGTYQVGAKSLITLCVKTLAQNIDLAEELGDLPPVVVDKIARELSRRRLLDPRTVNLFLRPSAEDILIYDGAKLSADDLTKIFQTVPGLKNLKIRNAIHFKDEVMEYVISRHINLEGLYLHGANLLTEPVWMKFLEHKGASLKSLKVYFTDKHFGNDSLALLPVQCPNLKRLKVRHNQSVSGDGVEQIGNIKSLEHLGLQLLNNVHSDVYVSVLSRIGENLRTFSLTLVPDADNTILDALHANCRHLQKLRITDSEAMTDAGFVRLFRGWKNPGLSFIDLSKCRHVDAANPRSNDDKVGLCSDGFIALMKHSGTSLKKLNVHACRHISRQAFETVFTPNDKVYLNLTSVEISFCEEVTDYIIGCIFKCCPNLRKLNVFGCMKVKGVKVPRGKILVGVPNAVGMVIDGDD